eukprot:TRINITY_DN3971_c0_g1_i1.p1 TRINITY_DN3971_c0_g1~~TRINITY_DN3971_c0_g1_i1.p1  ORF type:complete len:412 (+),score=96.28 TRINITY_DN3971_c0_g1_i1:54-1289(+)
METKEQKEEKKSPKWTPKLMKKSSSKKDKKSDTSEDELNPLDPGQASEEKIREFREHPDAKPYLDDPKHDNMFVSRFLRARKMDVNDAVKMFVARMKWREEMDVDNIVTNFEKSPHYKMLLDYWPSSQHWRDPLRTNDGSVILFEALGKADPSIIDAVGADAIVQFHIYSMENLERFYYESVQERGYFPGFVVMEDLGGIGMHTFSPSVLKLIQSTVFINQNYYPDMLRKCYVFNVPSIFYMFWKGISSMLEPRTLAKVELTSGNAESIKDSISQFVDLELLPIRLGGQSTRDIPIGGTLKPKLRTKSSYVSISRSSSHEVEHSFSAGDLISWEFKTKGYDIGFTVHHLVSDTEKKEVVAMERHEAHKRVVTGSLEIKEEGKYKFLFDNTFSWTRGKSVKYNIYKGEDLLS